MVSTSFKDIEIFRELRHVKKSGKRRPRKCVKNGFWNVGLRIVSSMNSAGIR